MTFRLFALGAFLCLALGLNAQNETTYTIFPSESMDVAKLEKALAMCDLDIYRKPNSPVTMSFKDGTRVELYSANRLRSKGIPFKEESINRTPFVLRSRFILNADGYILEDASALRKEEILGRREDK